MHLLILFRPRSFLSAAFPIIQIPLKRSQIREFHVERFTWGQLYVEYNVIRVLVKPISPIFCPFMGQFCLSFPRCFHIWVETEEALLVLECRGFRPVSGSKIRARSVCVRELLIIRFLNEFHYFEIPFFGGQFYFINDVSG